MLYDGAIRNLKLAEIAMENKDIEKNQYPFNKGSRYNHGAYDYIKF